jgi:hypothetical protein
MHDRLVPLHRRALVRVAVLAGAVMATLLLCSSAAAAEPWSGETTTLIPNGGPAPSPEATLVKAAGSYDPPSGALSIAVTTGAEPKTVQGGKPSTVELKIFLVKVPGACDPAAFEEVTMELFKGNGSAFILSVPYSAVNPLVGTYYASGVQSQFTSVKKDIAGTTTTLSLTSSVLANQGWNCTFVSLVEGIEEGAPINAMSFALVAPVSPPTPPVPTPPNPSPPTPPTPPPGPATLSIAKSKPLTLKVGVWETVKVRLANIGATAASAGLLVVKGPTGVTVKTGRQPMPILTPGASTKLSVQVKLTSQAQKRSTVSMTATAPGATDATGSFVLKLKKRKSRSHPQKGQIG